MDSDANQIVVRPIGGNGSIPYWVHDDILSATGAKLRRLVLVQGTKNGRSITFDRIDCFEDLQLSFFVFELVAGCVCIDFDARGMKPGSKDYAITARNSGYPRTIFAASIKKRTPRLSSYRKEEFMGYEADTFIHRCSCLRFRLKGVDSAPKSLSL